MKYNIKYYISTWYQSLSRRDLIFLSRQSFFFKKKKKKFFFGDLGLCLFGLPITGNIWISPSLESPHRSLVRSEVYLPFGFWGRCFYRYCSSDCSRVLFIGTVHEYCSSTLFTSTVHVILFIGTVHVVLFTPGTVF